MHTDLFFKALADTTRLRCLVLLVTTDELCVCELGHALGLAQPKISHHLAALRKAGLVLDRKSGLWVYYRINPQQPQWLSNVIHTTAAGVSDQSPFNCDAQALAEMPNRPSEICSA